jgi:4'-phosphopantetheinyl transferase
MAKKSRPELIEGILKSANDIFRVLLPTMPRELLMMDFTMPQLKTMFLLFLNGPTRMSDLAADLGVTLATATGLVDRLVEREMVTRESLPGDRRVVLCRLAGAGQKSVSRIWESARDRMQGFLREMDSSNLEALERALGSLLAMAERGNKTALAE